MVLFFKGLRVEVSVVTDYLFLKVEGSNEPLVGMAASHATILTPIPVSIYAQEALRGLVSQLLVY